MTIFRRLLISFVALATALPLLASMNTASAAPKGGPVQATVQRDADNVLIRIAQGSLGVEDGYLIVRNAVGATVDKFNLTFVAPDKAEHDVAAVVSGRTAVLTPNKAAKRKPNQIVCGPQTRAQRDQAALQKLAEEIGIAASIGAIVGAVVGFVLGLTTGPLAAISTPIGALVGAGIGLIGAGIAGSYTRYFETINSPFKRHYC